MSHYTVDYEGLSADEKRAKAIEDIKQFLGEAEFDRISNVLRDEHAKEPIKSYLDIAIALSFCGVQGYPVIAWYETLFGVRSPEQVEADKIARAKRFGGEQGN